ncbi:MAG: glycoside hydrolase family 127 protein [Armatimonadota bacterium]|nr:MAG: glycoside hydrolase family 127 protein [Armatimonadota bacterium]
MTERRGAAAPAASSEVEIRLTPFSPAQVRLLDGPCKAAQEADRRYLHALDLDRLLYPFRLNAGLDTPGEPLGGWEAPTVEVRGHFPGHYLSACARMYASTGDEELKATANAMVAELAKCQEALGGGYLSAFPAEYWDRLERMDSPPWAPYYVIHKIMAGLFDVYALCGNQQALDVLEGMAGYFKRRVDKLSTQQMDRVLTIEFGGMSEVLHDLYAVTGQAEDLELAHAFDQAAFLGPLSLEHDNLTEIHANTQIPKMLGAARHYELTGDERYRTAVEFFWERVVNTRSYATGGSNDREFWREPHRLAHTVGAQNQESCTTHNMLELTHYLIRWTGDPRCADYYERAFFNGVLGTQNPEDGMLIYFMPLGTGYTKQFGTPYDSFWCCYGTGVEAFSGLGDGIYFHDEGGLYVNLFIASAVEWLEKGVRLEQATDFPEQEGTTLVIHAERPTAFALRIRVPWWADRGVQVTVNGERVSAEARPTSYLTIDREWHDKDKVQVNLPMSLRAQPMPDDPELIALMYGPLVVAGLSEKHTYLPGDADDPQSWVKPVPGEPLTFRTVGQPTDVTFVPLYRVIHERYGVYWVVTQEGSRRHRQILADEEARRKRETRVVDRVLPGDEGSETAHNLQGRDTAAGPFGGKAWRHATSGGWWSWDIAVLPEVAMTLACTYWGDDVPPRRFDILVDGEVVATQSLNRDKPGEFFDVEYPIPAELTRGKSKVTVRFEPHEGNTAGGVFECAILKPE